MRRYLPWAFFFSAIVALIAGLLWLYGVWESWPSYASNMLKEAPGLADVGQLGDSYGALNAGFAGLAFAGVLVTLLIQLLATQDQQKQKHHEQFESRFFQLLDLGRQLRHEVRFSHTRNYIEARQEVTAEQLRGFAAFEAMHEELNWHLRDWKPSTDNSVDKEKLASVYSAVIHNNSEATVSPYFRILYTILRRIDEDNLLSSGVKHTYSNLVRSQITSAELSVASLNGLFRESANFSYFLEKARMFKYMPYGAIRQVIVPHYWFGAFLGRDECGIENPPASSSAPTVPASHRGKPWLGL